MTPRVLVLALGLAGLASCKPRAPAPALALTNARFDTPSTGPSVHFELELKALPQGDPAKLYVLIGCQVCRGGNRYIEWPELMARDQDPATTAETPPQVGQRVVVDVPLELEPTIRTSKRTSGALFNVIVTAFWGTNGEGPIDQAKAEFSVDEYYRRR